MAVPSIKTLNMQDIKSFGNLARTNLYQVTIGDGWGKLSTSRNREIGESFAEHLKNKSLYYDIPNLTSFLDNLSIMCSEATLPSSSYATSEVKDNYIGVPQEFAHTRINTDIDFTFYIDRDYKVLMFFEAWMDYISGGNNPKLQEPSLYNEKQVQLGNYYRRFKYPVQYKNSQFYIKKFERDYKATNATNISYQLINAFPKSMTAIPIAYGEAEVMKATVTMNYDRYVVRREYAPFNMEEQLEFQRGIDPSTRRGDIPGTTTRGQTGSGMFGVDGLPSDFGGGPRGESGFA